MPLLIDGHNLIGHIPGLRLDQNDDEAELVFLLRRYATRKRGRRVVVVFDHGVYGHPHNLNGYGVECHFAKSPQDADNVLIRRIRAIRRTGEWQVVTSDRAVAGEARAHGVRVVPSAEFARKLQAAAAPAVRPEKKEAPDQLSPREIQEWLDLFGGQIDSHDEAEQGDNVYGKDTDPDR